MGKKYSDQWDFYECEWCRCRASWRNRPCIRDRCRRYNMEGTRAKRENHEWVRMENAAIRNKWLPKVYRRALAMAKANGAESDSSLCTVLEKDGVDGEGEIGLDAEAEAGSDIETETEKDEVPSTCGATTKPTSYLKQGGNPKNDDADDANRPSQRQAKACTGPVPKDMPVVDEGVRLALSQDDDDIARIHAANRKAWPRGQEPISARATVEDKEIAELVRRGLIGCDSLQVNHGVVDELEEKPCPYTVRFVEARGRGKKRKGRSQRQDKGVAEQTWDTESDWWFLDDEAYAQLLSDGGTELMEWSETSSFVHVD